MGCGLELRNDGTFVIERTPSPDGAIDNLPAVGRVLPLVFTSRG